LTFSLEFKFMLKNSPNAALRKPLFVEICKIIFH